MNAERYERAVQVVKGRLEADDPQLPGADQRAERIVEDLFHAGLLAPTRRVERVNVGGVL